MLFDQEVWASLSTEICDKMTCVPGRIHMGTQWLEKIIRLALIMSVL